MPATSRTPSTWLAGSALLLGAAALASLAVPLPPSLLAALAVPAVLLAAASLPRLRPRPADDDGPIGDPDARLRLLESAVVHANDGVVVLQAEPDPGPGRRVLYANDAFCRMTGYTRDEVVGRSLHLLRGPASDPTTLAQLRDAMDARRPLRVELLNYRKDGSAYWVDLSLVPVPDPAGRVAHWVMVQRDISDRKRAEDALRDGEERLRVVGDNLPDGAIYQVAAAPGGESRFTYISAGITRLLGVTPEEALADGQALYRLIHPDDAAWVREAETRAFLAMIPFDAEYRHYTRAGELKWVHCRSMPARLPDGGSLWNGVVIDVTARKLAEEALRRSEELFRGIFEGTSAGLSLTDPTGRFVACNPAFAAMVGRSLDEVLRLRPVDITHPEDWEAQQPLIREVHSGDRDRYSFPKRYLRPDGAVVWAELSFAAIRGADGRYEYGLGVSLDVTARKRLEEQLRQSQKMEAIGRMAGGIAHDFNNLLTAVIGNLSLARLPDADPNRPLLAAAERAAVRAAELTGKLLGFARRNQIQPVPVSPAAAFDELAGILRRTLDPRVRIEVHVADTCGPVLADPTFLNQALLNLSLNARDAMPGGGTLTLSAEPVTVSADHPGRPADVRPGEFVRLGVADTGCGMTDEVKARIFEPFFTTKDVGKGTGLGLPMVAGIVEQHRGWVECATAPGAGTRMDLYLPAAGTATPLPEATPAPAAVSQARPADAGRTILLADDEGMIRELGRAVLESAGHQVLVAEDGVEAVGVFAREMGRIDLVVLDVTMPRMSGPEAYREMVRLAPEVRVLFSTGYSAEDISGLGGAAGVLNKPYRPHELLAAVRDALAAEPTPAG